MVKITTRIGHLNDPRIHKTSDGVYRADGITGVFRTWVAAFEALTGDSRSDLDELQNFKK